MKLLLFLSVPCVAAVMHSMKYVYTGCSHQQNFPEFVVMGLLDDVQFDYYDSNTERVELKQEWMKKLIEDDPQYLERETKSFVGARQVYKVAIEAIKPRFNHTGGVHMVQWLYGCEWDDETGEVSGFDQFGYDGEDFLSLDLENSRWIAAKQQAVITKNKWDNNQAQLDYNRNYHTKECPGWVKKHLNYGRSLLLRTELPTVSLLQRTPSSPVTCHATGFYPNRAELIWKKGDEDLQEDVVPGQILPNHDGTFQVSVDLELSRVKAEDWGSYSCVFQLAGVKDDIITVLDKAVIRTNQDRNGNAATVITAIVITAAVLAVVAAIALIIYTKRNTQLPPPPAENREVQEQMIPAAE